MSVGYLLSSLPMLFPERPPKVSAEAFIEACRTSLSARDADAAEALLTGKPGAEGHSAVQAWREIEAAIAGAIGKKRIERKGAGAGNAVAPETTLCPLWLVRMVNAAFESAQDPWAREQALLRVRWAAAEEWAGFDPASKRQVFAYAVKLRLALHWASLDEARGGERLEAALPEVGKTVRA